MAFFALSLSLYFSRSRRFYGLENVHTFVIFKCLLNLQPRTERPSVHAINKFNVYTTSVHICALSKSISFFLTHSRSFIHDYAAATKTHCTSCSTHGSAKKQRRKFVMRRWPLRHTFAFAQTNGMRKLLANIVDAFILFWFFFHFCVVAGLGL